jgi:5-methylcytosine-specific restriction endonuclease McrA
MPIKPEYKPLYGKNWKQLSYEIRAERAHWQCEWCGARHGAAHPITGANVVLTVAHLDQNPAHNDRANLAALCQRCHLNYDRQANTQAARRTRALKRQRRQPCLIEVEPK